MRLVAGRSFDRVHTYGGTVAVLTDVEINEFCLVWPAIGTSGRTSMAVWVVHVVLEQRPPRAPFEVLARALH